MIFRPELAAKVLAGEKTETRRPVSENPRSPWWRERCGYRPGRAYAVQDGRGKPAIGRVVVLSASRAFLGRIDETAARAEGLTDRDEFLAYWRSLYPGSRSAYYLADLVWVVRFRLIHPDDYPLWEGA